MSSETPKKSKMTKRPHTYLGAGLALGAGLGAALDNIAVGIALGLAFGAVMDSYHKEKRDDDDSEE